MRLLVCDNKKIEYYNIPNIVKDYFTINYEYGDNFETINLVAADDKWIIKSDKAMKITKNQMTLDTAELTEYTDYTIYLTGLDMNIHIYIVPDFEEYFMVPISNFKQITFGKTAGNVVGNNITNCVINENNGKYVITKTEENADLYVNKVNVKEAILNIGDVIFNNGIKIIWMDTSFKINNPNNTVSLNGLSFFNMEKQDTCIFSPVTESERNAKLFSDSNIFFHKPRFHSIIKEETVTLELPPEKDNSARMPMILSIGSSAVIGVVSSITGISALHDYLSGQMTFFDASLQFVMCILMLVGCIFFPIIMEKWQTRQKKKQEKLRQKRYKEYLGKKVETINKIIKNQEDILHENNITLEEIQKRIKNNSDSVWNREIIDDDFLTVRLGIGDLKAKLNVEIPKPGFSLYDDNLKDEVLAIAKNDYKTSNVPVTISLVKNKVTPFILGSTLRQNYIDAIMLQILYYYSAMDLKIIIFTNEENAKKWDYLKYSQYCFSSDREIRFFATNESEMLQISMYLEQEYDKRIETMQTANAENNNSDDDKTWYKNFSEYYLIITDTFKEIKNVPIVERIINSNINVGFSELIFETQLGNLPNRVDKFVEVQQNVSGIYSRSLNDDNQAQFKAEAAQFSDISEYMRILANIPIETKSTQKSLISYLNFLDMYKVGNISQLNILSRWSENSPINSLNAQVGIKEGNKPIGLDLHEKFHGPHGLIAGSTGSGKSEFIITYILSMAINYNPDEVQFVLIDYKGGGLAGAFENKETKVKLPHLIGTITNLDTSEMNRTLVSIQSEMKRRQRIFNEARDKLGESTIDIYKYQRLYREGKVSEPISHLFIISDEFAELKVQQPDFMDELVSTARIGRSLGVHLVLATQKPSGVVNDQIWSNSHFKVCLKVQTIEDSTELLRRPEASEIKETGRFYLQVGNNEIFELGQSAWTGANYTPTERYVKRIDDAIDFINNNGAIVKSINDEFNSVSNNSNGDQITNIVKYIYDLAKNDNYQFKSLWLPALPKDIYLGNLVKKYSYSQKAFSFEPIIGEYDKPAEQEQGLLTLDLNGKNTIIYGLPGSGKENLLSTLIYSACGSHRPDEINFYILDFGSGSLNVFNKMPHVGDIITSFEPEKVVAEFEYLEREIKRRKELFADYAGDYKQYCEKSGKTVPMIVTILNGYESFMENCGQYDDYFIHLLRDGSKYGIIFIMTVVSTNSVRTTLGEYFMNKILLQLPDKFDYQYILGAERGMVPSKLFGRGMIAIDEDVCEFQTAQIYLKDQTNDLIRETSKKCSLTYPNSAPSIKSLPKSIKVENMLKFTKSLDKIPIGYSMDKVILTYHDFMKNKINLIVGNNIIDDMNFMGAIIDIIDSLPNAHINLFDLISCVNTDGNMSYYSAAFTEPFKDIIANKKTDVTNVNIFLGIGDYKQQLLTGEIDLLSKILDNLKSYDNQVFIFIDDLSRINKVNTEDWFINLDHTNGIWYGPDVDSQEIFEIKELRNYDIIDSGKNVAYTIDNGEYVVVKTVGSSEEDRY